MNTWLVVAVVLYVLGSLWIPLVVLRDKLQGTNYTGTWFKDNVVPLFVYAFAMVIWPLMLFTMLMLEGHIRLGGKKK